MADDKKLLDISKTQDDLDTRLENLKVAQKQITDNIIDVKGVQDSIENEPESVTRWMADNMFRTDNPKRKEEAINALKDLSSALEDSLAKSQELSDLSVDLKLILGMMKEWSEYIRDLIPVLEFHISIPEFSDSFTESWDTVMGVTGIITGIFLLSSLFLGPIGLSLFAIGLVLEVILAFIGGIIAGDKRKEAFENIKKQADDSKKDVDEKVLNDLNEALDDTKRFFKDTAVSLVGTGLADSSDMTPTETRKVLEKKIGELRDWRSGYNTMTLLMDKSSMKPREAAELGAQVVAKGDEKRIAELTNLFLGAYLYDKGDSVDEVVKELGISGLDAKRLKARNMLLEGQTPDKIAKYLEIPLADVVKIKAKNDELQKAKEAIEAAA